MSSVNLGRIKQIRPKTNGGFGTSIRLGVDGLLTDMVSGLDLQQELTIGGNHYVTITNTNVATIIKEWFFSQSMKDHTLDWMKSNNKITYSVYIYIASAIDYYLIDQKGDNETEDARITWTSNEDDGIVDRVPVPSSQQRIQITLYQGNMENENPHKLHQKVITLSETSTEYGDDITISQQLDWDEGEEG